MKTSPNSFMNFAYDDYAANYLRPHRLYVAKFRCKDTGLVFGKIGISSNKTNYRYQLENKYTLLETYEFYFQNGIEAAGVESLVKAQHTKKYSYDEKMKHHFIGGTEIFKVDAFDGCLRHVIKCRQTFNFKLTEWQDQKEDFIYHDYTKEFNPWQI